MHADGGGSERILDAADFGSRFSGGRRRRAVSETLGKALMLAPVCCAPNWFLSYCRLPFWSACVGRSAGRCLRLERLPGLRIGLG
jgi:hypothetical protein